MSVDPELGSRIALGVVLVGVTVLGLPHRLRADRAGGQVPIRVDPGWFWILMGLVGPPVALVCLGFLIQPRWVDFGMIGVPPWLRLAGAPLGFAGLTLFRWTLVHLGANVTSTSMPRATATLVTAGPYAWIRHPMYSATFVLVLAASLLTANAVVALGGFAMCGLLAARSRLEEQRLEEKFDEAYRAYQRRTGRFLPRWPRL